MNKRKIEILYKRTAIASSSIMEVILMPDRTYLLLNKDIEVLKFIRPESVLEDIHVLEVYRKDLLPYRIKDNLDLLDTWLRERPVPTNREHIIKLLESVGITQYDHMELLSVNNGCSLNDTYWIREETIDPNLDYHKENFEAVSLYSGFKESLGLVSFFGNTSSLGGKLKTPEITTQGMLGKAWRIVGGKIKLYKAGSSGFANAGLEPYMEVIASKVAQILELEHIDYKLDYWNDKVCCVCDLFTNEDIGYLPMAEYLKSEVGETTKWTYSIVSKHLNDEQMEKINDMIVFDYIIENTDRHFNNFGFMIDNNTRKIIKIAPLFDHGMSLHWNKLPRYDTYNRSLTNKGTFDVNNSTIAKEIIKLNPQKYKSWARKLKLGMKDIETSISYVNEHSRKEWISKLLIDRCEIINNINNPIHSEHFN